jgi:tRNA(Arg) A34 adenosine deaminase TadA
MAEGTEKAEPAESELVARLLGFIELELLPATERAVARGNKIFGGGMLKKGDLSTVIVGTNNEIENPLWHGEVHTIKLFYELPREQRPRPKDIVFIASHEPCPLCLSAITWAGYDNFYYLFSHEDSRDSFNIGHDLRILQEVFKQPPGGYARTNAYWRGHSIGEMIGGCDEADKRRFGEKVARISARYDALSDRYQASKHENEIPFD